MLKATDCATGINVILLRISRRSYLDRNNVIHQALQAYRTVRNSESYLARKMYPKGCINFTDLAVRLKKAGHRYLLHTISKR